MTAARQRTHAVTNDPLPLCLQHPLAADLPDTATTGRKAVLKVWCMPIDKVHKTFSWRCGNTGEGAKAVQFLVAQQKVMEECGLMDVTIKVGAWLGSPWD